MLQVVSCPLCDGRLQIPAGQENERVRCPHCGNAFDASDAVAEVQPVASDPWPEGKRAQALKASQFEGLGDDEIEDYRPKPRPRAHYEEEQEDEDHPWTPHSSRLPGRKIAIATMILLGICVFVNLLGIGPQLLLYEFAGRVKIVEVGMKFDAFAQEEETIDQMIMLSGLVELLVLLPTAVLFCCWIYRANANLRILEARRRRFSPGWAVGYFFIPFINLVRPCQVAQEIWRGSDPEYVGQDYTWKNAPGSAVVGFWWAFYLMDGVVARISFAAQPKGNNPALDDIQRSCVIDIASNSLTIVAGLLAILMIGRILRRQTAKFSAMHEL
jgi:hypothetical protein